MNRRIDIFTVIDPNDMEGLRAKALVTANWLKILSIINLVIRIVIGILAILLGGLIGAWLGGIFGLGELGAGVVIAFVLVGIFLDIVFSLLTIWYTGRVKQELDKDIVPSLITAYVMAAFTIINFIRSIVPEINPIGLTINILFAYLWYTLITSISNLGNDY